jgi:hypothetical protein
MWPSKLSFVLMCLLSGGLLWVAPAAAAAQDDIRQQIVDPMDDPAAITLIFDFFVGGRYQGDVVVTYNDTLLSLHEPRDALGLIPNAKNAEELLPLLRNPIESQRVMPGLGRVTINRDLFRVEVYVEPQHLTLQRIDLTSEQMDPIKNFGLRSDVKVTGNTNFDDGPTNLSVRHSTQPAIGRDRLDWQGVMNRGRGYTLTDLAYVHETGRATYRTGLLETQGQRFAASREFVGVEAGTTEKTLFGNPLLEGSQLEVFVPEAGRVEVFRGDQLIFARQLEFGLQQLDTSRFPSGSYEVEIVITDRSGNQTRERRLFTRSRTITPFGTARWKVQAGLLRDNVDATDTPVFQGTYSYRVLDNMELEGSIYGSDNKLIFASGLKGLWGPNRWEAILSWTPDNDSAVYGRWDRDLWDWGNMQLTYSKTLTGHTEGRTRDASEFDALSGKVDSLSLFVNGRVGEASVGLRGTRNVAPNGRETYSYGPNVRYPLIASNPHRLDLNMDWLQTDQGANAGAFLRYSYIPVKERLSYASSAGARQTNGESSFSITNSAQLRPQNNTGLGTEGQLQNTHFMSRRGDSNQTVGNLFYRTPSSRLGMSGSVNQTAQGNLLKNLAVEGQTALLYADGKVSMSSIRASGKDSAVLIAEIVGSAKGQEMNILSNGRVIGTVRVGQKVAISLEPFRTYAFELRTTDRNDMASYSSEKFVATLFPGNVTTRQWVVNRSFLAFGRLVDPTGRPIAWRRISGMRDTNVLTDSMGYFSVELTGGETPFIASESHRCTVAMPHLPPETEYFVNVGDILCL